MGLYGVVNTLFQRANHVSIRVAVPMDFTLIVARRQIESLCLESLERRGYALSCLLLIIGPGTLEFLSIAP